MFSDVMGSVVEWTPIAAGWEPVWRGDVDEIEGDEAVLGGEIGTGSELSSAARQHCCRLGEVSIVRRFPDVR